MVPTALSVAETGNGFIDNTHAALLRHIGDIREQCAAGTPRDAVVPCFDAFITEMTAHFDHEDLILRAVGYECWEEHAMQHKALGRQVGRLVDYLRECDVSHDFLCTVAGTLEAALNQHRIKHDDSYANLLRTMPAPAPDGVLIAWTAGLETGIEHIDAEHRELADLVNEMHRMAGGVLSRADALALLERVGPHVRAHFDTEERVLRAASPVHCLHHAASHKLMEEQFVAVRSQIAAGVVDLGVVVRDFLRFWLVDHIVVCDRPHFLLTGLARPLGRAA